MQSYVVHKCSRLSSYLVPPRYIVWSRISSVTRITTARISRLEKNEALFGARAGVVATANCVKLYIYIIRRGHTLLLRVGGKYK